MNLAFHSKVKAQSDLVFWLYCEVQTRCSLGILRYIIWFRWNSMNSTENVVIVTLTEVKRLVDVYWVVLWWMQLHMIKNFQTQMWQFVPLSKLQVWKIDMILVTLKMRSRSSFYMQWKVLLFCILSVNIRTVPYMATDLWAFVCPMGCNG